MRQRMKKDKPTATPEMILAAYAPEVRRLAESLREFIKTTVPAAREKANPGWHGIGYHHPESGYFCAIFPTTEGVRVGFEWGALLADPQDLLEGTGKQLRYLPLGLEENLPEEALRALLLAALDLPAERSVKLELLRQAAEPAV